jgi:hypothetical protein
MSDELLVEGKSFVAEEASMSLDFLVVALSMIDQNLHGCDQKRALRAEHLAGLDDIFVGLEMLIERVFLDVRVKTKATRKFFCLLELLIVVAKVRVGIFWNVQSESSSLEVKFFEVALNIVLCTLSRIKVNIE